MTQPAAPKQRWKIQLVQENCGDAGCIAWLSVDHPGKLNILNSALMERLLSALEKIEEEMPDLRAVILHGAGESAFIGGADVREMATLDPDSARAFITQLHKVCARLRELPVPVIAKIDGYCLGAGLEVAASCDIRIASDRASFGMPEVRVGIPSVIEAALLPRLIGWGKTRELLYTGGTLDANEALACGLVERVVPPDALESTVESVVHSILQSGPQAIRAQKALIRQWESLPYDEAIARSIDAFSDAFKTDEPKRMMNAFLERKKGPEPVA